VGPVAYELELPADSKIHLVFHVSLLRPARGSSPSTPPASLPWQRRPSEETTWENYDLIDGQFPSFRLENTRRSLGSGILLVHLQLSLVLSTDGLSFY
nr:reverse transcriptase [Tanacetum cinerariifolium]